MQIIFCDDDTCAYNDGAGCKKPNVHIVTTPGGIESGRRIAYNLCVDYMEVTDARTN